MAQSQLTTRQPTRTVDISSEYGTIQEFSSADAFADVYPDSDFEQADDSSREDVRERAHLVWALLGRYEQHSLVGMPDAVLEELFPDQPILGGAVFAIVEDAGVDTVELREVYEAAPLFAYQCQLQNLSDELAQAAATGNLGADEGDTRSVDQIERKHNKLERRLRRKRPITDRRDEPVLVGRGRINALGRAEETVLDE